MAHKPMTTQNERRHDERGLTLIETMIAAAILLIVVVGVLNLFTMAITTNQQQGNIATRTTEYAQDKMEQLMALSFNDRTSNTTVFPVTPTGGTGLVSGGSIPPAAPLAGYVDYLDENGNLLTGVAGASYVRQWQIARVPSGLQLTSGVVGGGGSQTVGVTAFTGGMYAGNNLIIDQGLAVQETVTLMAATVSPPTITASFLNTHLAGASVGAISKTITVVVTSKVPGVVQGVPPSTTVVAIKSAGM